VGKNLVRLMNFGSKIIIACSKNNHLSMPFSVASSLEMPYLIRVQELNNLMMCISCPAQPKYSNVRIIKSFGQNGISFEARKELVRTLSDAM
jgi:hypothetical protein